MMQRMIAMGSGGGASISGLESGFSHSYIGSGDSTSSSSYTPSSDEDIIFIAELTGTTSGAGQAYLKENGTTVLTLSSAGGSGSSAVSMSPATGMSSSTYFALAGFYKLQAGKEYKIGLHGAASSHYNGAMICKLA